MLLLFAAAIFVTALVAGRMRATSDDAGGNAAAAAPWALCREVRGMRYRLGALLSICSGGELVAQYGLAHLGA